MAASLHLADYSPRGVGRMLRAMRRFRPALEATPGLATTRILLTARLEPTFGGTPTPTKWVLFCGWDSTEARDDFLADPQRLRPFTAGATESLVLSLDTVRVVQGDWHGWLPSTEETPPLGGDEPVAVITHGRVTPRHLPAFTWSNRKVVREMRAGTGPVMDIGLAAHPLDRTTFSIWRTKGDVVRAAYGAGTVHAPVQRRSLEVPWGGDWFFARFRPVASSGTWDGRDPLAGLREA